MGSAPVPKYQTLLDELLSAAFDENESGLTFLAHQFAKKPFDSGKFKRETHKAGNHIFRRFRNTHLRNYTNCPEGLVKFWIGHAPEDMSDHYDKIKENFAFLREVAERSGIGFGLPLSFAPIAPICTVEVEVESAT